jgi:hypothetical protein
MTKRRVLDPELVDPATVPAPRQAHWMVYKGPLSGLVTTDEALTIWKAPDHWRHYIGMNLLEVVKEIGASCSPVHQPDPPANRS